jgi:PPOX class probable F420-dependent enzyme
MKGTTMIPERLRDLLSPEKKAFASIALTLSDGSPQVTPIWFDWDGTHIILNTARGRVKDKVMHRSGKVALLIVDPGDPYRYLQIRGRVVDETEAGAFDVICDLNLKYRGDRDYPKRPGEVRVTYKVLPEQVFPKQ